jgi:tetratricopeptide (TPR) repeat protein
MAARVICPSCEREIREPDPVVCPFCEFVFAELDTLRGDEEHDLTSTTAEAMIVGDLDGADVIDAPTFIPGAAKSYLFYGSGSWKENVRAILESPASTEPVYPSEMTADDLGEGVDPDVVDPIEGDTLKIQIPERPKTPPPAPPPPKPKAPDMDVRSRKLYEQAEVEKARGDIVAAHRNVKLALTFDPQNHALKKLLSQLAREIPKDRKIPEVVSPTKNLADRAAEKEREGDVEGAIELLERALRTQKDAAIYNRLGVILAIRKKDFARGRAMIEKALDLAPDNETYRHNLSKVLTHAATVDLERGRDAHKQNTGGGIFGIFGKKK